MHKLKYILIISFASYILCGCKNNYISTNSISSSISQMHQTLQNNSETESSQEYTNFDTQTSEIETIEITQETSIEEIITTTVEETTTLPFSETNPCLHRGLFSWHNDIYYDMHIINSDEDNENDSEIFENIIKNFNITEIYQHFSSNDSFETINQFVNNCYQYNLKIYTLDGEPEWYKKSGKLLEEIQLVQDINEQLPDGQMISGIVFDIEPYLLSKWDKKQEAIMEDLENTIKEIYNKKENLEVLYCIPYFYDSKGYEETVRRLAKYSDGILVMNYYKGSELKHIETEYNLCNKYNKKIITIYEIQPPDRDNIDKINSYYHDGNAVVEENFLEIYNYFQDENVGMAYHDYDSLKQFH